MLTNQKEFRKDRGLRDQLQRAIGSVGSNIAEEFDRSADKDFVQLLGIAKASVAEVRAQLSFGAGLDYINEADQQETNRKVKKLGNLVDGFIHYLKKGSTFSEVHKQQ